MVVSSPGGDVKTETDLLLWAVRQRGGGGRCGAEMSKYGQFIMAV